MLFSELLTALKKGDAGLESHHIGNDPKLISGSSIQNANSDQLTFLERQNSLQAEIIRTNAGAVLIPAEKKLKQLAEERGLAWAIFKDPKLAFAESLELLTPRQKQTSGIHPTAVIEEGVSIGQEVYIGPHVCIGEQSQIGSNCVIHPGVVIYEKVILGEN